MSGIYRGPGYTQSGNNYLQSLNGDGNMYLTLPDTLAGDFTYSFMGQYLAHTNTKYLIGFTVDSSTYSLLGENGAMYSDTAGALGSMGGYPWVVGSTYLVDVVRFGGIITVKVDGATWGVFPGSIGGVLNKIIIGPNFGARFDIFEVALYNHALDATAISDIITAKRAKWGIV